MEPDGGIATCSQPVPGHQKGYAGVRVWYWHGVSIKSREDTQQLGDKLSDLPARMRFQKSFWSMGSKPHVAGADGPVSLLEPSGL